MIFQYRGKKIFMVDSLVFSCIIPWEKGGAVVTQKPLLHKAIRQFRDWGRDCWCDTGKDNTCGKRFKWQYR